MVKDDILMRKIHQVTRVWAEYIKIMNRKLDIPTGCHKILLYLSRHSNSSQKDIAEFGNFTPSFACQTIRQLQSLGLVTKLKNQEDGRYAVVSLTDKGRAKANQIIEYFHQADSQITDYITKQSKDELISLLDVLENIIREKLIKID